MLPSRLTSHRRVVPLRTNSTTRLNLGARVLPQLWNHTTCITRFIGKCRVVSTIYQRSRAPLEASLYSCKQDSSGTIGWVTALGRKPTSLNTAYHALFKIGDAVVPHGIGWRVYRFRGKRREVRLPAIKKVTQISRILTPPSAFVTLHHIFLRQI